MKRLLFLFFIITLLASCRSTRQIQTAISKKDTTAVHVSNPEPDKIDSAAIIRSILDDVSKNTIDYKTFTAKINADYSGADGKNYNLNVNLRMYKDSAIWISANAILGIEAMRLLVTKDSVKMLDKINKTYTERSLSYLQEVSDLPLDLKTLQDLLIGNPVFLDSAITSYSTGNGTIRLLSIGQWFKNLLTVNETDKTVLRSKLDDAEITRSRTADLEYSDYENKKGVMFSTKRRILVTEKNRLDIKMDFKQYDFNAEVSFPFSIPKNYQIK